MHICRVSLWAELCLKVIVVFAFVVRRFKENRYVQAVILDSNWSYVPFTLVLPIILAGHSFLEILVFVNTVLSNASRPLEDR